MLHGKFFTLNNPYAALLPYFLYYHHRHIFLFEKIFFTIVWGYVLWLLLTFNEMLSSFHHILVAGVNRKKYHCSLLPSYPHESFPINSFFISAFLKKLQFLLLPDLIKIFPWLLVIIIFMLISDVFLLNLMLRKFFNERVFDENLMCLVALRIHCLLTIPFRCHHQSPSIIKNKTRTYALSEKNLLQKNIVA